MNLTNLFKGKQTPETIERLLGKDAVKKVVDDFVRQHMPTAEGVIIIWAKDRDFYFDTDGLSLAEVIGGLHIMGHEVEHEGLPRK